MLAIKDLEIRGAGEILGSNQSGVFDSIGLDLYTRMIRKATDFIKNVYLDFHNLDDVTEINLNESSNVLLFGCEGDADEELYQKLLSE